MQPNERQRLKILVPVPAAPGFAAECQRQSRIAFEDASNQEDLEAFAAIADWGED